MVSPVTLAIDRDLAAALALIADPTGPIGTDRISGARQWYLATCVRCGGELSQPFTNANARDRWAIDHCRTTAHVVVLSGQPRLGPALILRWFSTVGLWAWHCSAHVADDWAGQHRYEVGQMALADALAHLGNHLAAA